MDRVFIQHVFNHIGVKICTVNLDGHVEQPLTFFNISEPQKEVSLDTLLSLDDKDIARFKSWFTLIKNRYHSLPSQLRRCCFGKAGRARFSPFLLCYIKNTRGWGLY